MTAYDRQFLESKGLFDRADHDAERIDDREVAFASDPDARLAYLEAVDPASQGRIVAELQSRGLGLDYYWFWNPDGERVAVYARYGDRRWFVHDASGGHAANGRERKERRLDGIDEGLAVLFDDRDVVDRFYRDVWDVRLALARSLEVPDGADFGDEERLVAAQRTIDRAICCSFLVEMDVVHGVDAGGDRFPVDPGTVFEHVLADGGFDAFLTAVVFDHLTSEGWTTHAVSEELSIAVPFLGDRLFRARELGTVDGGTVPETDLEAPTFDWRRLVKTLTDYRWVVDAPPTRGPGRWTDADGRRCLSPSVLAHTFETFAVTVGELAGEGTISLDALEGMAVSASGEHLLEGNRRVGAYYTPAYIAYENVREALWARVCAVLEADHGVPTDRFESVDQFLGAAHDDGTSLPIAMETLEDVLAELTVLDPAVGCGAFLVPAADILERWRSHVATARSRAAPSTTAPSGHGRSGTASPSEHTVSRSSRPVSSSSHTDLDDVSRSSHTSNDDAHRAAIRREVLRDSLHGVDLLEGAVELCRVRLWLWVLGATQIDLEGGPPTIRPLPGLACSIRQGNSLVGVADLEDESLAARLDSRWTDGGRPTYAEAVDDYRETVSAYRDALESAHSDDAELSTRLATQRRILHEEFTRLLAAESDARIEDPVASVDEFQNVVDGAGGRVRCRLDFDDPMTDAERQRVAEAGFREQRNWPTTATLRDARELPPAAVAEVVELLDGRGTIELERPVAPSDVAAMDPVHWLVEFPTVYRPTADPPEAFDVVVGNPPHGSSISAPEAAVLADVYALTRGGRDVAKLFVERSWALTGGELSYVVPKACTYNSNWEDVRGFCLDHLRRGVDLGTAFRGVDHEQVTIHLSRTPPADRYGCGTLAAGAHHLEEAATMDRAVADRLGTLPVSFTAEQAAVVEGLAAAGLPTLGDLDVDAGRGAATTARVDDPSAPIAFNGREVQRYRTRAPRSRIDTTRLSGATARRLAAPKVMAQNIVAHRTTPYDHVLVAAAYDPVASYSFETVTNVVVPEDGHLSAPALALLLNTRLANWYVYVPIFNRAVRDMHLDAYFLDKLVVPDRLSADERSVLEDLYGLLAITGVAVEWDLHPHGVEAHRELQSVANALAYELYLRDLDGESQDADMAASPLATDLAAQLTDDFAEFDVAYLPWYRDHLTCATDAEIAATFRRSEPLFDEATRLVDSLRRPAIDRTLHRIADHSWVEVVERGRHRRDDRPCFGTFGKT